MIFLEKNEIEYLLKNKRWSIFVDLFEMDPNVVAVGPYLSCDVAKHIQGFFVALDKRSIRTLEKTWRCPHVNEDRYLWILDTEVVFFKFYVSSVKIRTTTTFSDKLLAGFNCLV